MLPLLVVCRVYDGWARRVSRHAAELRSVVHERESMPWKLQDQQIFVHRPDLARIPELILPDGYAECPNPDDLLPAWVGLLNTVFGDYTIDRVRPQLDSDRWDADRVKLVTRTDELVALSMAWHEPALWPYSGFVFWVAVAEAHRGQVPVRSSSAVRCNTSDGTDFATLLPTLKSSDFPP